MEEKMTPRIAIVLGSDSDFPIFQKGIRFLEEHSVPFSLEVTSAHRTPDRTEKLIKDFEKKGVKIIIAAAGGAAHLPGVIASRTLLPVLGVPIVSPLLGLDSLLSMTQMPGGIPVAAFGIGESGAFNAILFALSILSFNEPEISSMLQQFRRDQINQVVAKSQKLKDQLQIP